MNVPSITIEMERQCVSILDADYMSLEFKYKLQYVINYEIRLDVCSMSGSVSGYSRV